MSTHLLISDLHLDAERPEHLAALKVLLTRHAGKVDSLHVLGDLFETWIGDDDDNAFNLEAIAAFRDFSRSGSQLFFMHGNRDFLLGEQFCHATGGRLLEEGTVATLAGQRVLLMHGDSLCTLDEKYQQFRAMVRAPAWQADMLAKPLEQRRLMAQMLRMQSRQNNANKADNIMDVTPAEVVRVMQAAGVSELIHGHTHRPAVHDVTLGDHTGHRWVLGDWNTLGWQIRADADNGIRLESFAIADLLA